MDYRQCVGMQWLVWRDAVTALARHLGRAGLYLAIAQCRSEPPALWAGLPDPYAAQRDELRFRLCELAEKVSGEPWPISTDLPPVVPDDAAELVSS
jgi:hypothetical protein